MAIIIIYVYIYIYIYNFKYVYRTNSFEVKNYFSCRYFQMLYDYVTIKKSTGIKSYRGLQICLINNDAHKCQTYKQTQTLIHRHSYTYKQTQTLILKQH
jgi:hypothetical protein